MLIARIPHKLLIAGDWAAAGGGERFEIHDAAAGQALASVADATPEDGIRAVDASVAAADDWAATSPRLRAEVLRGLRGAWELFQERREDLTLLMTLVIDGGIEGIHEYLEIKYAFIPTMG